MSSKLQPVRGTQDLMPETSDLFRALNNKAYEIASRFGYQEIATPIFEFSEVFHRTLGETSDAVSKETYTFLDRGGDSITLRPEGTAGIARAFVSEGLAQKLPLKVYYCGPMFRYERPQKGRYRQFHQIGVECLGLETPRADVECLSLAAVLLEALGLNGKFKLEINTLGDKESRLLHRDRLVSYLTNYRGELSPESQIRLDKNPLRILDSKSAEDQKILTNAPLLRDCLNSQSKDYFAKVQEGLSNLKIPFEVNDRLVRGFDYYTHTVFEFTTDLLGAQSAILAGGRYNGLIEMMGGPSTPGIGWAAGMERLALLVNQESFKHTNDLICVLPADENAESYCELLGYNLRALGRHVEILVDSQLGKRMKKADKMQARYVFVVGETELKNNSVSVKNLKTGEQKVHTRQQIIAGEF